MNIDSIAARTKIAVLSMGKWTGSGKHKAETLEENKRHGTNRVKGVSIQLCEHAALVSLAGVHAQAYQAHVRLTRPTIQEGMRLLPLGKELEHKETMNRFRDEHEKFRDAFLLDYEDIRQKAPEELNSLFDSSMFPTKWEMTRKFKFSIQYLPAPTSGEWSNWIEESAKIAQIELKEQIVAAVKKITAQCKPGKKLFASVFDNLRDLFQLLPDLDLDGEFQEMAKQATNLTTCKAEELKEDKEREEVSKQADELLLQWGKLS